MDYNYELFTWSKREDGVWLYLISDCSKYSYINFVAIRSRWKSKSWSISSATMISAWLRTRYSLMWILTLFISFSYSDLFSFVRPIIVNAHLRDEDISRGCCVNNLSSKSRNNRMLSLARARNKFTQLLLPRWALHKAHWTKTSPTFAGLRLSKKITRSSEFFSNRTSVTVPVYIITL